jgi:ABC-type Fe3+/spermidine/putrescine transport system ATPase subunit
MVFQSYALWPHMTVFNNIAFGLRERKIPKSSVRDKVHTALEMVNLEGMEERRPSQLSGGQQQRVALARTLVIEPRLLLLDEPLSNLDAKLRVQMRNELLRIQRELGITTIYVTHDQEEALAISTQIAVMSEGVVIQQGSPREIYEAPWNQTVADFVGTSNFLKGEVAGIDGDYIQLDLQGVEPLLVSWKHSLDEPPLAGVPLILNIRPESVRISKSDSYEASEPNQIRGNVITSIYLGSLVQYEVETSSGQRVKVNSANPRRAPLLQEGEPVVLTFSPHDAVLLHSGTNNQS